MNEQEANNKEHTLNQLLGTNNYSIWKMANELREQGFPLDSVWVIKLEQVIK